jgi:hypothetical protein
MTNWTWPADIIVELYYWRWAHGRPDRPIHGWSLAGAVDATGAVRLEAEHGKTASLRWVDRAGHPTTEHHTFVNAADLPPELRDEDGQPIAWLREMIDRRQPFHGPPHPC